MYTSACISIICANTIGSVFLDYVYTGIYVLLLLCILQIAQERAWVQAFLCAEYSVVPIQAPPSIQAHSNATIRGPMYMCTYICSCVCVCIFLYKGSEPVMKHVPVMKQRAN